MHEGAIDLEDMKLPMPGDDDEDIMQYKFPKFAATYFVGNTSHTYIRRALKVPLLPIRNEGDQLVSICVQSSFAAAAADDDDDDDDDDGDFDKALQMVIPPTDYTP